MTLTPATVRGDGPSTEYYRSHPEAAAKKVRHQAEINKRPGEKARRVELNRERRRRGIYGKGGPDVSHTSSGDTILEAPSKNRARNGEGGRRLKADSPWAVGFSSRQDSPENGKGQPCGRGHIPRNYKCSKEKSSDNKNLSTNTKRIVTIATGAGLLALSLYAAHKWSKADQQGFENAKTTGKTYRVSKSVPEDIKGFETLGRGADGVVYVSPDKQYAYKQAHNPKEITNAVTMQLRAQKAGVNTATIVAYDKERGIIKMKALMGYAPINKQELSQSSRREAGNQLFTNYIKLHRKGLMHNDVSSRNILVDNSGNIRLIDFSRSSLDKRVNARRSELNSCADLAEYLGYIDKNTKAAVKQAIVTGRQNKQSYEETAAIIQSIIQKSRPPKNYKLPVAPVDSVINLDSTRLYRTDSPWAVGFDADPCWEGYQAIGMKRKGKKRVPNCVPVAAKDDEDGKKYTKVVTNPETGRKNRVRYGAKGYKIAPGTDKGDRYCARSFGDMKSHGKDCSGPDRNTPLCLSRAKWKCSGKTSRR